MALIKEMQDVLKYVEQMPHEWQMDCVRDLAMCVDNWEQRQQEPELTDDLWWDLKSKRFDQLIQVRLERLEREFPFLKKTT